MKKTISITLGGLNFHIEEDAYQALDRYLAAIRHHYKKEAVAEEILNDIESSIAEKFSEAIGKRKRAITLKDVEESIAVIGKPEEITAEDGDPEKSANETETAKNEPQKRLYRDPDHKIIGGVCSGLAAYFGIDPVFVRVGFMLLALLHGIGVIAYLILWMVLPKAKTGTQKLEMQGRPVNLAEIQEAVRERAKIVREEGREAVKKLKQKDSAFYRILNLPIRLVAVIFELAKQILKVLWPLVCMLVGASISIGSFVTVVGMTVVAGVLLFNIQSPYLHSDVPLSELAAKPLYYVGVISFYFAMIIPLILLTLAGISLAFRKSVFRLAPTLSLAGLWVISVAGSGVAIADLGPWGADRFMEIRTQETVTKTFAETNFNQIVASQWIDLTIKQGPVFRVEFQGRQRDLEELTLSKDGATLRVGRKETRENRFCLFCPRGSLKGTITMPTLEAYTGEDWSEANVEGLGKEGVVTLRDFAEVFAVGVDSDALVVTTEDGSSVFLQGYTDLLEATAADGSRIEAKELKADDVRVSTKDHSSASVWAEKTLEATSADLSHIDYQGAVPAPQVKTEDWSEVIGPDKKWENSSIENG